MISNGRDHSHFVAVFNGRGLALEGVDLLAIDVDVDVPRDLIRLVEDHVPQPGKIGAQPVQHLTHGLPFRLYICLVPGHPAERRWYIDCHGHLGTSSCRHFMPPSSDSARRYPAKPSPAACPRPAASRPSARPRHWRRPTRRLVALPRAPAAWTSRWHPHRSRR